jgi:hypothetical protein
MSKGCSYFHLLIIYQYINMRVKRKKTSYFLKVVLIMHQLVNIFTNFLCVSGNCVHPCAGGLFSVLNLILTNVHDKQFQIENVQIIGNYI